MKILTVCTLFLFVGFVSGQRTSPPVLIHEFGDITCEDFLARSDHYVFQLNNDPTATGLVVLNSDARCFSKLLQTTLNIRLNKTSRVTIREIQNGHSSNRFWLIPTAADSPNLSDSREVASFPQSYTQKTLFSHEGEGPCSVDTTGAFATVLNARNALGGLVIIHGPAKERADGIDWIIRRLTTDNNLPRNRFRVFYRTKPVPYTEFWIVPIRKK